jgi:hypothetical protein
MFLFTKPPKNPKNPKQNIFILFGIGVIMLWNRPKK